MEAKNNNGVTGKWVSEDNMFSGQWINRNTGNRITISNSMMDENNNMILITSIGEMTMDMLSRNYIQDTEGPEEQPIQVNDEVQINQDENYLLPEDQDLLNRKVQFNPQPVIIEQKPTNKYQDVLDKFFNESKSSTLNLNIDFDFNLDELKTLMKYIDLSIDDISEYIFENMINKEKIKEEISNIINDKFQNEK